MKVRINVESMLKLLLLIIFIALLEPNGIIYSPLHSLMGAVRYLGLFLAVLIFFGDKIFLEKMPMLLLAILIWMGVSTYLYNGELDDGYIYAFRTIFTAIVLSAYSLKHFPRYYVMMMGTILSLWVLLDGLTWKDGGVYITENDQAAFFLGTKTTITYYLIPALAFDYVALKTALNKSRIYAKFLSIMTILGAIFYLSREPISTAIVCSILGVLGYIVVSKFNVISEFICKYGFTITSVLNFAFITGNALNIFGKFFVNILNEDVELNGRTQIWKMVLKHIRERYVIGHGYASGIKFDVWQEYNTSTHNYFLYILFTMGIIGFFIYIIYIIFVHKDNEANMHEPIYRYLMCILVIMNIEAIAESYGFNVMTFGFLVTIGYAKNLIAIKNNYSSRVRIRIGTK